MSSGGPSDEDSRDPDSDGGAPASAEGTLAAPALLQATRHLLRPLVRLLLRHQITYPQLTRLLKSIYLESAEAELAGDDKPPTASRLSLATGLHRKDIKRLREEPAPSATVPASVSLGTRLLLRWTESPEYCDAAGSPRALPRMPGEEHEETPDRSFEGLVRSVSTDIRARAVLDEWLRLGIARIDDDDRVHLVTEAFVPRTGFDEKAHFFGRNLHDHLAAGVHNLLDEGPPLFERSVHYDGLSPASVAALSELASELGMSTLKTLNRRALALRRRDAQTGERSERMNFGMYFLREAARAPRDDDEVEDDDA